MGCFFPAFETEFCTIKQEIEAVKQFDSRISNTEHELLTLKHNVQVETAELKDNQDLIRDIQKNISDAVSTVMVHNDCKIFILILVLIKKLNWN